MTLNPLKSILVFFTVLIFSQYVKAGDTTSFKINDVPFRVPGKWEQINQREESGQYGFVEANTRVSITLSARQPDKMEFYKMGLTDFELVNAFYKWDADYWNGGKDTVEKLSENKSKNYIVWRLKTSKGENIILFGMKSGKLVSIHLNKNEDAKMNDNEAIVFLESIFTRPTRH